MKSSNARVDAIIAARDFKTQRMVWNSTTSKLALSTALMTQQTSSRPTLRVTERKQM